MSTADYSLFVDWTGDGVFNEEDEVTSVTVDDIQIAYGRDRAQRLAPPMVGSMSFTLLNDDSTYHPENTASALAGLLLPHRGAKLQAVFDSITYELHEGFLDDFTIDPNPGSRRAAFGSLDGLGAAINRPISTVLHEGVTTGEAIGLVLDELGWPTDKRDLDAGSTTIQFWWEEGTGAWEALQKLLASEGPPAILYVDGTGTVIFRDRHHRLVRSESTASQATFSDSGTEPNFSVGFAYDYGWRDIVNTVSITVTVRDRQPIQTIWAYGLSSLSVPASTSVTLRAVTDDPFVTSVGTTTFVIGSTTNGIIGTHELGSDSDALLISYTIASGSLDAIAIDRISGQSISLTFTAGGSGALLTDISFAATPVTVISQLDVQTSDAASITAYGPRSWDQDPPWMDANTAFDVATMVLNDFKDPHPKIDLVIQANGHDDRMTEALARTLSDRITVEDATVTGFSDDFYIDSVSHTISRAGKHHATVFGCESVKPSLVDAADVFILDSVSNGELNQNELGY